MSARARWACAETSITVPDPGQRILVRQELLDANPGTSRRAVSLPSLPIETASGGIKAPQYFVFDLSQYVDLKRQAVDCAERVEDDFGATRIP
jgi:hypothetical protein